MTEVEIVLFPLNIKSDWNMGKTAQPEPGGRSLLDPYIDILSRKWI